TAETAETAEGENAKNSRRALRALRSNVAFPHEARYHSSPMMSMMSMMRTSRLTLALGLVAGISVARGNAQEPRKTVADLMQIASVKTALAAAKNNEPQAIDDQIRFCEIPAAPFNEGDRGTELRRNFQQLGLQNVRVDSAGNVLGDRPGAAPHPRLVIAAHLDTVFPEGTDVHVRRDGTMLYGPGIGDDCRGLGVLVATIRALKQASVQTPGSITFVADVGEEGLGDLRGVKQL